MRCGVGMVVILTSRGWMIKPCSTTLAASTRWNRRGTLGQGRRMVREYRMLLDRDPRWLRLHDHEWTCPCCGLKHGGLFDLVSARPAPWPGGEEPKPNSEVLTSSNILTEDFCIL